MVICVSMLLKQVLLKYKEISKGPQHRFPNICNGENNVLYASRGFK